jgi:hypothetical protein
MAASTTPIIINPTCTTAMGAASRATSRISLRVGIRNARGMTPEAHSHSIVAGGFDDTSYTTRFTPLTSLMIRDEIRPITS